MSASTASVAEAPAPVARRSVLRAVLLPVHRWVGLAIAVFLVVAGLTGTALAWYHELDAACAPHLHAAARAGEPLPPSALRARLAEGLPGHQIHGLPLHAPPGAAARTWATAPDGALRECFVDVRSGEVLGTRVWGDLSEGAVNLMPFVYRLHYQLALGEVGTLLFGVVALLWTVDCFVGLWLTFPPARAAGAGSDRRGWFARWLPAWTVRAASLFAAIFTVHRAAGLWLWALLLVFAWSAVGFNLRPVYQAAMGAVLPLTDPWSGLPSVDPPRTAPALGWDAARETGRALMAAEAGRRGFAVAAEGTLAYEPSQGLYRYDVYSSLDLGDRWPGTRLWFDGDSGALHAFDAPTGIAAGNTVGSWLMALHMATVGGPAYRLLVAVLGVAVAALSVTGAMIWWRKRRRSASHPPTTDPSQPPPARMTQGIIA